MAKKTVPVEPEVQAEVEKPMIMPGNPHGYQAGDPDAPVDVPPLAEGPSKFGIIMADTPVTEDDLEAGTVLGGTVLGGEVPVAPPSDVPPSNFAGGVVEPVAQPAMSEQTRMEIEAGRRAVARFAATTEAAKQRVGELNAARLRNNAPADAGDLDYTAPKE